MKLLGLRMTNHRQVSNLGDKSTTPWQDLTFNNSSTPKGFALLLKVQCFSSKSQKIPLLFSFSMRCTLWYKPTFIHKSLFFPSKLFCSCLSDQCTCNYFFYPPSHQGLFSPANSPSKHQEWVQHDKLMSLLSQPLHLACLTEGQNLPIAKFIQLCCSLSLVTTTQFLQVPINFHGISTNAHVQQFILVSKRQRSLGKIQNWRREESESQMYSKTTFKMEMFIRVQVAFRQHYTANKKIKLILVLVLCI